MPEIKDHCPGVKIILVALKCDLRDGEKRATLTYEDGVQVAKRIKAARYLECSAKMNRGVQEAFVEIANVAIGTKDTSRGSIGCTIA